VVRGVDELDCRKDNSRVLILTASTDDTGPFMVYYNKQCVGAVPQCKLLKKRDDGVRLCRDEFRMDVAFHVQCFICDCDHLGNVETLGDSVISPADVFSEWSKSPSCARGSRLVVNVPEPALAVSNRQAASIQLPESSVPVFVRRLPSLSSG